jgi:uncharacterized delta-60 repeat protein
MTFEIETLEIRTLLAAGGLDPSFGDGGRATPLIDYHEPATAAAVVVRPDGRILVAGGVTQYSQPDFLLEQLNPDGTVDPTFGDGGRVRSFGSDALTPRAAALQSDGKVVVAGISSYSGRFIVARYNADGTPDNTFGRFGSADASFGGIHHDVSSVVVRADGRILVGGRTFEHDGGPADDTTNIAFAQFLPDGRPDPEFGSGKDGTIGYVTGRGSAVGAMALLPDGRVLVAGRIFIHGREKTDPFLNKLDVRGELSQATEGNNPIDFGAADDDIRAVAVLDGDRGYVVVGVSGGNFVIARVTLDGRLQARFGDGGKAVYDFGSATDTARTVLPLADGRFVVVGTTGDAASGTARAAAVRFTARGRLDRTFGVNGPALFDAGAGKQLAAAAAATTPAGRIIVVGTAGPADDGDAAALELTPDGALDPAFGPAKDGRALYPSRTTAFVHKGVAARQADGKILVVASMNGRLPSALGITRLNADGSVDRAFGAAGTLFVDVPDPNYDLVSLAIALAPGGRILLAVNRSVGNDGVIRTTVLALRPGDGGKLDASFGDHGRVDLADRKSESSGTSVLALQADGRVLVAQSEGTNFVVYRLTAAGRRDGTFGSNGRAAISVQLPDHPAFAFAEVHALAVAPDGRIVLAGVSGVSPSGFFPNEPRSRSFFTLARLTAAGQVDRSFGGAGVVTTTFPDRPYFGTANAVLILPDGRILAGGAARLPDVPSYGPGDLVLARYRPDGSLDPTFGVAGRTTVPLRYPGHNSLTALTLERDGKILAVGDTGSDSISIARLTPDGRPDPTYGNGGYVTTLVSGGRYLYSSTALPLPDGQVVVGGTLDSGQIVVLRFRSDDQPPLAAQVDAGVLRVRGTVGDDRIILRRNPRTGRVEIQGLAQTFDPATFSRVDVQALDGDDRVDLSALNVPTTVNGGAGDDVVLGSSAADSLLGSDGKDTLFGGNGNDTLGGGDGNDYLNGGRGADQVSGDAGNDQVFSLDGGRDTVDGGAGFDRVKPDADDLLTAVDAVLA